MSMTLIREKLNFDKVLIVVAHPDDEVLGCGGLIKRLIDDGKSVFILILGEGSSCRYSGNRINTDEVALAINDRAKCAQDAFKLLGVKDFYMNNFTCGRFDTYPIIDLGKEVERVIELFDPDTVLTHYRNDNNSDHRLTFNAVMAAARPTKKNNIKTILSFEVLSSTEWRFSDSFKPNFFVDIGHEIDFKVDAFLCYASSEAGEFPFPRSEEGIKTLAKMRGMQIGVCFAEAFEVIRISY